MKTGVPPGVRFVLEAQTPKEARMTHVGADLDLRLCYMTALDATGRPVDAQSLTHLSRCDLLPEAWMADRHTQARRQQVRLRISLGQHRAA